MWINWLVAGLGLYGNFAWKYKNRRDKTTKLSFKFWWRDNWPEHTTSVAVLVALMLITMSPEAVIDLSKLYDQIPIQGDVELPANLVVSFLLGLYNNKIIYRLFKEKTKDAIAKNIAENKK